MAARKSDGVNAGLPKDPMIEASDFRDRHLECVIPAQHPWRQSLHKRRYCVASISWRQDYRPVVINGTAQASDIENDQAKRDERECQDISKFKISTQSDADGGALRFETQQLKESAIECNKPLFHARIRSCEELANLPVRDEQQGGGKPVANN